VKTFVSKLLAASSLAACFALMPHAAHATYGAVYKPSLAPAPPPQPVASAETFLDGITPGKTYTVQVTLTNAGTTPWTTAGLNSFHLAYHWDGPAPWYEGERTDLPYDVLPGETVTVDATLKVPTVPGTYVLRWDMVHEGITWFSSQGVPTEDQVVGVGGKVGADQGQAGEVLYETEHCKWTDCSGEVAESCGGIPQISSAAPKILRQDDFVVVQGCGFGGPDTVLYLMLPASNMMVKLEIQDLYPTLIGATVPGDLIAPDQQGFLRVVKPGSQSNDWPVSFVSLKDIVLLSQDQVQVFSCSDSADYNWCNGVSNVDPDACTPVCSLEDEGLANPLSSFSSVVSFHETDGSIWGDSGKDVYKVSLKNGWKLHKMDFAKQITNNGSGTVDDPAGFVAGASNATITVEWSVGGNSGSAYYIDLYAIGPKGTQP
jgi:hypothetical protein